MVRVKDLVPNIYYEESRDFQVFGNAFETVFNYLKTNVDLVNENPLDRRSSMLVIKLITKTLGFDSKHEYDIDDLRTICSIFIECLKNKGTLKAINMAISGLLNSQHITSDFKVIIENNEVQIYLPKSIRDVVLLEDLFDYILPAGITYNFIYGTYALENKVSTPMSMTDSVVFKEMENANLGTVVNHPDMPQLNKTTASDLEGYDSDTKVSQTYTGATGSTTTVTTIIKFKVGNSDYQAEPGMTWDEWLNSAYNTDGFTRYSRDTSRIHTGQALISNASIDDVIVAGYKYKTHIPPRPQPY